MKVYRARIRFLGPDEGGRTLPVRSGYRPMLLFPGERVFYDCQLVFEDDEPKALGCAHEVTLMPFVPEAWEGVATSGRTFQMFEGPRRIGEGTLE